MPLGWESERACEIGIDEILQGSENIVCIEWPERIPSYIPADALHITLDYTDSLDLHLDADTHQMFHQKHPY